MTCQAEASALRRFFQYVEDGGLQAYDQLVIQNAWDISRESDRLRRRANAREEKVQQNRQGRAIPRTETGETKTETETEEEREERTAAGCGAGGKYLRTGSASGVPGRALGVRSRSLSSVGDDEHKRPPPKPRRDPATKLSGSSEALPAQSQDPQQGTSGDEWKKTPPPKPRRDPNTQLSWSRGKAADEADRADWADGSDDDPESVYIEMAAKFPPEEQNESVYEEMQFPERRVPQPFPNLLTPRPPLLVFPPAPPQRSPNSDESPLTPVDVAQLSMAGKKAGEREERPPSGRSSAPPLRSAARSAQAYPRSRSACPSPVARSPTPCGAKRPPPYEASVAGRLAGAAGAAGAAVAAVAASPDKEGRNRPRDTPESKCLRQLGRSASTPGASASPRDRPALGQMCGDVTMMETMEKKRVLCREIQSRRRAEDEQNATPWGRGKRPPPYPAAPARVVWDSAI
ncbi:neuronal tyrosine-phosphorylated phosphoinositide-3-kinase adapter 2-like [Stigmatopora argus]